MRIASNAFKIDTILTGRILGQGQLKHGRDALVDGKDWTQVFLIEAVIITHSPKIVLVVVSVTLCANIARAPFATEIPETGSRHCCALVATRPRLRASAAARAT